MAHKAAVAHTSPEAGVASASSRQVHPDFGWAARAGVAHTPPPVVVSLPSITHELSEHQKAAAEIRKNPLAWLEANRKLQRGEGWFAKMRPITSRKAQLSVVESRRAVNQKRVAGYDAEIHRIQSEVDRQYGELTPGDRTSLENHVRGLSKFRNDVADEVDKDHAIEEALRGEIASAGKR